MATLTRLAEGGHDPRHVFKEFLVLLRRLLLFSAGSSADVVEADRARLTALARAMPYENLLRALTLAVDSDQLSKRSEDSALVLQMLILRLCELPRLRRIEEGLTAAPRRESLPAHAEPSRAAPGARFLGLVPVETETVPSSAGETGAHPGLARFHEILDSKRRLTAAQASLAESIALEGEELVLRFGIDRAAAKEALEEPAARKLLSEVAREAFGRPLRVVFKTGPPADGDLGLAAREVPRATISRERAATRAETDPVVRSAMELFRAELTEVKEEE
jgi:DNA polymerase III gamma/tau subunit